MKTLKKIWNKIVNALCAGQAYNIGGEALLEWYLDNAQ